MTIGADTALHRIIEALDSIRSTASSHQRTFVVEVMGRNCGYLALMAALASSANFVLIPEQPPEGDHWEQEMFAVVREGRASGRRQSLVLVSEGAQDSNGRKIDAARIKELLETELGEDARITILGHVQRGGAPSAFDRYLSTLLGSAAVDRLLEDAPDTEPQLIGLRGNQVVSSPLMDCVAQTHAVAERIKAKDLEGAMMLRGGSFSESYAILRTLQQAAPRPTAARPPPPPARRGARRRPRTGDEHGRTGGRAAHPRPRVQRAGDPERLPRPARGRRAGARLDERQRLGRRRRRRDRHQPLRAGPRRRRSHRETDCAASDRRHPDGRRLGGLPGRARAVRAPAAVPGAGHPDRLHAGHHQQRPAGHRAVGRQRHGAEQHHGRRRQDQAVGGGVPPLLRGRGDGPGLRVPGADERPRDGRRAGVPAGGRHHAGEPDVRRAVARPPGSGPASGSASSSAARTPTRSTAPGSSRRCWRRRAGSCSTPGRRSSVTSRRAATRRPSTGSRPPG